MYSSKDVSVTTSLRSTKQAGRVTHAHKPEKQKGCDTLQYLFVSLNM